MAMPMDGAVFMELMQFGVAGLVAWMWLAERRAAVSRERELSEAHDRLMEQRVQLDALVRLVEENTRAVTALEVAERELVRLVGSLVERRPRREERAA